MDVLSAVLSIFLTAIGILFASRYSSIYHVRVKNRGREKYRVLEKIAHGVKGGYIDSARIVLEKSSFDTAMGFMDISLTTHPEEIHVDRYAFIHSCIHNVFAPGKAILKKEDSWTETAPSNQFDEYEIKSKKLDVIPLDFVPNNLKNKISECRAVESEFNYPETYTGPRYKKRLLILAKGIGIVYSKTEYINGNNDIYILKKHKVIAGKSYWLPVNKIGNYWVYDITYEHGPNKLNMCE